MDPFICTASRRDSAQFAKKSDNTFHPAGNWTTLAALAAGHFNSYRQYEPGVIGIGTQPSFAIGQRALLVCTPSGNVVGLHCDAGPRDHHLDQWPRWPEGYRHLASALLYHNGGMEPRVRRRSDPPSCR